MSVTPKDKKKQRSHKSKRRQRIDDFYDTIFKSSEFTFLQKNTASLQEFEFKSSNILFTHIEEVYQGELSKFAFHFCEVLQTLCDKGNKKPKEIAASTLIEKAKEIVSMDVQKKVKVEPSVNPTINPLPSVVMPPPAKPPLTPGIVKFTVSTNQSKSSHSDKVFSLVMCFRLLNNSKKRYVVIMH